MRGVRADGCILFVWPLRGQTSSQKTRNKNAQPATAQNSLVVYLSTPPTLADFIYI